MEMIDLNSKEAKDQALNGYTHTHQAFLQFQEPYYCSYCQKLDKKADPTKELERIAERIKYHQEQFDTQMQSLKEKESYIKTLISKD